MDLAVLPDRYSVCRLDPRAAVPEWALTGPFFSVTRTADELSIVCMEESVPGSGVKVEKGFRALKLQGPLAFGLTGVLAPLLQLLASAKIPVFTLSTFDTDYILVPAGELDKATQTLRAVGHRVRAPAAH